MFKCVATVKEIEAMNLRKSENSVWKGGGIERERRKLNYYILILKIKKHIFLKRIHEGRQGWQQVVLWDILIAP